MSENSHAKKRDILDIISKELDQAIAVNHTGFVEFEVKTNEGGIIDFHIKTDRKIKV